MKRTRALSDETIDRAVAQVSDELAGEAGALADVLENWRRPEVARAVVESLLDNDRDRFSELLQFKIDGPGDPDERRRYICYKLLLLVEKLGQPKFLPGATETCYLRTDLSPEERRRYLAIVLEFSDSGQPPTLYDRGTVGLQGPEIPPGPFLEALKAERLVTCVTDPTVLQLDPRSGPFQDLKDICGFSL